MATFKITVPQKGAANANGTEVKLYNQNEMIDAKADWEKELMVVFVDNGWAVETKMQSVSDVEVTEPVRARNTKGHYQSDDESTPDVNEAYVGGVAPKAVTNKKTTKRTTKKKS